MSWEAHCSVKKESLLWKQGTIFVVLLFCGLAFAPSIHANVSTEEELVEVTTEFCGLGKKHTVQLTQEQADELDQLFDEIKAALDNIETREEAVEIFDEAIVELDKYGLLGGLSIEQARKLVIGGYQNPKVMKLLEKIYNRKQGIFDENTNILCLIAGRTDRTVFGGNIGRICLATIFYALLLIKWAKEQGYDIHVHEEALILAFLVGMTIRCKFSSFSPIAIGHTICIGKEELDPQFWWYNSHPAHGWIFTIGMNIIKWWRDSFFGQLRLPTIFVELDYFYPGIFGFTGIKLLNFEKEDSLYLGSALFVKLDSTTPPEWPTWFYD